MAKGKVYSPSGAALTGFIDPVPGEGTPGLKPEYASMRFVNHVEGGVAAWVRKNGIRDAVLYLNMGPCRYPDGCRRQIESALPPGWRLTVYAVDAKGGYERVKFTGTGRGIRGY